MTNAVDPRTPVLVGVGQVSGHPGEPCGVEPVELMAQAMAAAVADAGCSHVADVVELIAVVQGAWAYTDPAALLKERFGRNARTVRSADSGHTPQALVNEIGRRIATGGLDAAFVTGGEANYTRKQLRAAGTPLQSTRQTDATPDEAFGVEFAMWTEHEASHGMDRPLPFYPLFETALRHAGGETVADHRERIGELWKRFNDVAVANPFAWDRRPRTAAEIVTPSPDNRMVSYPYTKAMCSNWYVDQAAALLVCSAEMAGRLGVPRDRWVFLHAGADGAEVTEVSYRARLDRAPSIRAAARAAFDHAQINVDDLAYIDLYSCFPSAVQVAAAEVGVSLDRQLTLTGGLTFAGGPMSNYSTHAIASMAACLRGNPGTMGLVTANGGMLTKHAVGVYGTTPPLRPFPTERTGPFDGGYAPRALVPDDHAGPAKVEAYIVPHDSSGPVRSIVACEVPDGRRAWAHSTDSVVAEELMATDGCGRDVKLTSAGNFELE